MTTLALPPKATVLPPAYYSTQPFLAWCLNHYVYDETHYTWCSRYLFPYRALNPKSSNPYQIFQDLYQPSYDRDQYDSFVRQMRLKLRIGVEAVVQSDSSGHPYDHLFVDLLDICDRIDVSFFWPVVYIVDAAAVQRGQLRNSAFAGSEEVLITDLKEAEFMLVAPDFDRRDPVAQDFVDLLKDAKSTNDTISNLLNTRC